MIHESRFYAFFRMLRPELTIPSNANAKQYDTFLYQHKHKYRCHAFEINKRLTKKIWFHNCFIYWSERFCPKWRFIFQWNPADWTLPNGKANRSWWDDNNNENRAKKISNMDLESGLRSSGFIDLSLLFQTTLVADQKHHKLPHKQNKIRVALQ